MTREELIEKMTEEDVIKIMRRLGATEFVDNGHYLSFPTVCHNEFSAEAGFNLAYYKDTKLFRCFSECNKTFDIFGMVRHRFENFESEQDLHMSNIFYFVYNYIEPDHVGIDLTIEPYRELYPKFAAKQVEHELSAYDDEILDAFYNYYPIEWLNDHVSREAMDAFNIKFSHTRNAVVIPHYDINNRLVGIRQRSLDPVIAAKYGKYRPMYIEGEVYNHPLGFNLYGLNKVKDNISKHHLVIIAEGEKAVLQSETLFGRDNVTVAVCGSNFNRWHLMLLLKYTDVREIIIAFDNEEEDSNSDRYFNELYELCEKYNSYINMSFIYNTNLLPLKSNMFDLGDKETCLQLIKGRVKV